MAEMSPSTLYRVANAKTKQAYPAAEEARPAAVGKLFSEQMWMFQLSISEEDWCVFFFTDKNKYIINKFHLQK